MLSTCNRTEITGFAKHPFELISLMVKYSNGSVEDFINVSNVYKNNDAVNHLFNIGTGLESQILGDYEIVGQLKDAFKLGKKFGIVSFNDTMLKEVVSGGITTISTDTIFFII